MFQGEEQTRCGPRVGLVDQDRATLQHLAIPLQEQVDGGSEERAAGTDQFGPWCLVDLLLVKTDPLIALQHRDSLAAMPIALAHGSRHVGDLETPRLAAMDLATETRQSVEKEGLDEMRLQPASVGPFHLLLEG